MRDHALIGKFIGLWPTEKALRGWIVAKWNPKWHITLQLGPKGFFTTIFNCLEDHNRVMDGGPYFFNAASLYLRGWVEHFNPDKEDLSWALVWIRLYSLPMEYWEEASLQEIGNVLGEFIKVAEETKLRRYTYYAQIYVYMRLSKALSDAVSIYHDDVEWVQLIDYEHVPFRCRRCHALGHLFRDCPLNKKPSSPSAPDKSEFDGFTKVANRKKNHKKPASNPKMPQSSSSKPSTSNNFEALARQNDLNSENPASPESSGRFSLPSGFTLLYFWQ